MTQMIPDENADHMSQELQQEIQELIAQIESAFDGVARGDGVSLHETRSVDDCETLARRRRVRESDNEARWQDVPDEDMANACDVMCFLDPLGFRYYIPAYMVCSLRILQLAVRSGADRDRRWDVLNEADRDRWWHVLDETESGLRCYEHTTEYRWSLLNSQQCLAIKRYVEFMSSQGYPFHASDDKHWKWSQFDDEKFVQWWQDTLIEREIEAIDEFNLLASHRMTRPFEEEIDDVIAVIDAAFDGVELGKGVSLHESRVIYDEGTPEEEESARALDTETRWQDVPHEDIRTIEDALLELDPLGFRYYLPAYMIWALLDLELDDDYQLSVGEGNEDIHKAIIWELTPYEWHEEQFEILDDAQSRAVTRFLQIIAFYAWRPDAGRALRDYWNWFDVQPPHDGR
jgi:hypothetical protein